MKNIPNYLTLFRLFSIIPILYILQGKTEHYWLAIILIIIALVSDICDGWLARKYNAASEFGAMLDSVTDKSLIYAILFSIMHFNIMLSWLIILLFIRDMLTDGLRAIITRLHGCPPANIYGKLKFGLQIMVILVSLSGLYYEFDREKLKIINNILLGIAFLVSLAGAKVLWDYYRGSLKKT